MWKFIRRVIAVIVLAAVCAGGFWMYQGYSLYREALEDKSLEQTMEEVREKANYTSIDQLPRMYKDAVVAVEDHRFYKHPGIDVIAIGRALWNDLKAGKLVEGGSTITQQLAKNLFFGQEKKLSRKTAEIFMSLEIEKNYSKDEILELYINSIYFGNGYYCVYDASQGYFSKKPGQMSDYECTLLAGIPNAPSVYGLYDNPQLAARRQKQVLDQMVKNGYLTNGEVGNILGQAAQ